MNIGKINNSSDCKVNLLDNAAIVNQYTTGKYINSPSVIAALIKKQLIRLNRGDIM